MQPILPPEIVNRKDKVNFATPGETIWLRNEMRGYIEDILHSDRFKHRDIYNQKMVANIYRKYLNGDDKQGVLLWRIMALEKWFNVFIDQKIK